MTEVTVDGRKVVLDAWPVGTDPEAIQRALSTAEAEASMKQMREELGGQRLIVSIGRVDYVKGTKEMLLAYEPLLTRRPDLHEKVKLVVTSVKANEGMAVYRNARQRIEQLVGHINGRFSRLGWSPILLFTDKVAFDEVLRYYRLADVCWTTPLRDGLNLVAKEYVAAHGGEGGALVLSEFTGVSVELADAVLVNPYSARHMDAAIERALDMSEQERRERAKRMHEMVTRYDIAAWAQHVFDHFDRMGMGRGSLPQVRPSSRPDARA